MLYNYKMDLINMLWTDAKFTTKSDTLELPVAIVSSALSVVYPSSLLIFDLVHKIITSPLVSFVIVILFVNVSKDIVNIAEKSASALAYSTKSSISKFLLPKSNVFSTPPVSYFNVLFSKLQHS